MSGIIYLPQRCWRPRLGDRTRDLDGGRSTRYTGRVTNRATEAGAGHTSSYVPYPRLIGQAESAGRYTIWTLSDFPLFGVNVIC